MNKICYTKYIILALAIMIMFFAGAGVASATDYYIKTDGNDTCSGLQNVSYAEDTINCAWATIQHAADTVEAGDTVLVQSGTYTETVVETTSGTAEARIIYQGVDNPIIDASGGTGFQIKGDYVTVTNFSFKNANYGVWVFEADYANVNYNTMDDFSVTTGILIYAENTAPQTPLYYPTVEHNTINATCHAITLAYAIWGGSISYNTLDSSNEGCDTLSFFGAASNGSQNPPAYGWRYYVNFVGNTIRNGRNGFGGGGLYHCNITDNYVDGFSHNAFNLHGTQYSLIANNRVGTSCPGYTSHALFPVATTSYNHNNIFRDNYIESTSGCGVYTYDTKDSIMENTKIDYCGSDGILILNDGSQPTSTCSGNWTFRNITFNTNSMFGIRYGTISGGILDGDYYFADISINGDNLNDNKGWTVYDVDAISHIINANNTGVWWLGANNADFQFYYPLDIKVVDANGNPIDGATVTIINNVDSNYPSINYNWENKTTFITGAEGHTPLPSDRENTAAIMDFRETNAGKTYMSHTITAEKDTYSNSTTVNPDETWYRSEPDTYQNTVTIVLDTNGLDTTSPYTSNHSPAKDIIDVSRDTNIIVHIKDDRDGVDQSLIVMTVEGNTITPTITGTVNDYTLTYTPATPFDYDQVIDITIDAQDLASPPNVMSQDSYSFTIEEAPSPPDTTSPSAVTDLSARNPTSNSIKLTWTASGDDGDTGTASSYDIRYSTSETTEANWNSATQCIGESIPQIAGSTETFTVTGLSPSTTYYFALKTADEAPNWSGISSSPSGTTLESAGDLVGYWKFDEGSENIAYDSSGNNNNGTLINNPIWVDGKIEKALEFDGADDYLDCGSGASLFVVDAVTVEMWKKGQSQTNFHYLATGINSRWGLYYNGGNLLFWVRYVWNGTTLSPGISTEQDDQWHHVVGTYDREKVRLFVDSVEVGTGTSETRSMVDYIVDSNQFISNPTAFNGTIDEVRIYNRALSAEEVLAHYQEGLEPEIPSTYSINLYLEAKPVKGNRGAKVCIYNPGGTTTIYSKTTDLFTNSNDDLELDLSDFTENRNSNYDILIKVPNYLDKKITNHNLKDNITTAVQLKIGDLNDDNQINTSDWTAMQTKWHTSDTNADFNEDGLVNTIDFSFMNRNWLSIGD